MVEVCDMLEKSRFIYIKKAKHPLLGFLLQKIHFWVSYHHTRHSVLGRHHLRHKGGCVEVRKEAGGILVLCFCLAQAPDMGMRKVFNTSSSSSSHCWSQPCENPWVETTWTIGWAQSSLKIRGNVGKGVCFVFWFVLFGMHCPEVKTPHPLVFHWILFVLS